ncbi:MAG: cellulase family glycosylhydrolase, partial [Bacteroidota bacterium]
IRCRFNLNLHLILDNHTFDPAADTDPNIGAILEKVWVQMAAHYKDRSELLYYEVLNEPHGIADDTWNAIQQKVVEKIRTVDTKHTIIVGGAGWNSYNNLAAMPVYNDDNLIYTFHFYDPFVFTHQGATWVSPSMEDLRDVPFPYAASEMPGLPPSLSSTWVGGAYNGYASEGNATKVKELIDIAVAFRDARNVPVFCGEFGVYIPNSQNNHRVAWYQLVQEYLSEKNIAWTIWDYKGGFGLFEGANELFDHDLNVGLLEALGFNVPPQTPFAIRPDSSGFPIYTDQIEAGIIAQNAGDGSKDFYNDEAASQGQYAIEWTQESQYGAVGFDFRPNKDLSYLVENDYLLSFLVRSDASSFNFDVRFIDTKVDDGFDRPWRMRVVIDNEAYARDGEWQAINLPLSTFAEHGSWDDNMWFNPTGNFDWQAIDYLEFVSEYSNMGNTSVYFDNIQITDQLISNTDNLTKAVGLVLFPNPTTHHLTVQTQSGDQMRYELRDLIGRLLLQNEFYHSTQIEMEHLPKGIYTLSVWEGNRLLPVQKILRQ